MKFANITHRESPLQIVFLLSSSDDIGEFQVILFQFLVIQDAIIVTKFHGVLEGFVVVLFSFLEVINSICKM